VSTNSSIQWTDATWNPVAGCSIVSAGCAHCYAMKMAHRLEAMGQAKYRGLTRKVMRRGDAGTRGRGEKSAGVPVWTGKLATDEKALLEPLSWRRPRRVFVNSMSDLFHEDLPLEFVDRVFAVMALCPQHQFQVLTKRPERAVEYFDDRSGSSMGVYGPNGTRSEIGGIQEVLKAIGRIDREFYESISTMDFRSRWPLRNLWLGASCEDRKAADERIPHLLRCPAAVRFLSCEPLLGPIDLTAIAFPDQASDPRSRQWPFLDVLRGKEAPGPFLRDAAVDWVIIGGESGPGARPCDLDWIESIVRQCREAGVACFVKQIGAHPVGEIANCKLKDRKGGDPAEWPASLRVREFPSFNGPAGGALSPTTMDAR